MTEEIVLPEEIDAELLCKTYASGLSKFSPEVLETLAGPVTHGEREAFVAFRYGTKKFKVTFEQVDRLRLPKGAE